MKIAIIGPTHPYKGGIAKHTTELAHQLDQAGHDITLFSWKHQYPFFYPGQQFVPQDQPEVPVYPNTVRELVWRNPIGWWRLGRKLRSYDQVIFIWWVPLIQGPVYGLIFRALGKNVRKTILCHNVLRHEARAIDKSVVKSLFKQASDVIVHSKSLATQARNLGATNVRQATLPPVFPPRIKKSKPKDYNLTKRLLFFGIVRDYKGLDVLLRAIKDIPEVSLTVAGEIWDESKYLSLIQELGIADRVELLRRYVADDEVEALFQRADVSVLPYRAGTATFNVDYAHYYFRPVIATTASTLSEKVHNGVDGLLCSPDDVASLTKAIRHFYEPGVAKKLYAGIKDVTAANDWHAYVATLLQGS